MKYHVKKNGEPGECTAQEGNCPFGSDEPHFDDKDSAWKYSMENLRSEYGAFPKIEKVPTADVYTENSGKYSKIFSTSVGVGELTRANAIEGARAVARAMREDLDLDHRNMMRADENPDGRKTALFTYELALDRVASNLQSENVSEEGKELIMEELRANGVSQPRVLDDLRFVVRSTLPFLTRSRLIKQSRAQVNFALRRGVSDSAKIFRSAHQDYSAVKPKVLLDESLDSLSAKEFARYLDLPWHINS